MLQHIVTVLLTITLILVRVLKVLRFDEDILRDVKTYNTQPPIIRGFLFLSYIIFDKTLRLIQHKLQYIYYFFTYFQEEGSPVKVLMGSSIRRLLFLVVKYNWMIINNRYK